MNKEENLKQTILNVVTDLVSDFLYYDRKEDEDLSVEQLENAISSGVITKDEIVNKFRDCLNE